MTPTLLSLRPALSSQARPSDARCAEIQPRSPLWHTTSPTQHTSASRRGLCRRRGRAWCRQTLCNAVASWAWWRHREKMKPTVASISPRANACHRAEGPSVRRSSSPGRENKKIIDGAQMRTCTPSANCARGEGGWGRGPCFFTCLQVLHFFHHLLHGLLHLHLPCETRQRPVKNKTKEKKQNL